MTFASWAASVEARRSAARNLSLKIHQPIDAPRVLTTEDVSDTKRLSVKKRLTSELSKVGVVDVLRDRSWHRKVMNICITKEWSSGPRKLLENNGSDRYGGGAHPNTLEK